jgi:hypothetical protein
MKLAEALLLRADRNRALEQLKQRIQVSARYQEGEQPPEDARNLVSVASAVLDERDVLRLGYSMLKTSADAASGAQHQGGFIRATRSELKFMRALDVRDLRLQASDVARQARELARCTDPRGQLDHRATGGIAKRLRVKLVGKDVERVPARRGQSRTKP